MPLETQEEIRDLKGILGRQSEAIHCMERELVTLKNAILGINGDDGVLKIMRNHEARIDALESRWMKMFGVWAVINALLLPIIVKVLVSTKFF